MRLHVRVDLRPFDLDRRIDQRGFRRARTFSRGNPAKPRRRRLEQERNDRSQQAGCPRRILCSSRDGGGALRLNGGNPPRCTLPCSTRSWPRRATSSAATTFLSFPKRRCAFQKHELDFLGSEQSESSVHISDRAVGHIPRGRDLAVVRARVPLGALLRSAERSRVRRVGPLAREGRRRGIAPRTNSSSTSKVASPSLCARSPRRLARTVAVRDWPTSPKQPRSRSTWHRSVSGRLRLDAAPHLARPTWEDPGAATRSRRRSVLRKPAGNRHGSPGRASRHVSTRGVQVLRYVGRIRVAAYPTAFAPRVTPSTTAEASGHSCCFASGDLSHGHRSQRSPRSTQEVFGATPSSVPRDARAPPGCAGGLDRASWKLGEDGSERSRTAAPSRRRASAPRLRDKGSSSRGTSGLGVRGSCRGLPRFSTNGHAPSRASVRARRDRCTTTRRGDSSRLAAAHL